MNDENDSLPDPQEKSYVVPRSSYTLNNALRFQRFFDLAISTKQNVSLAIKPKEHPDYLAPSTLKNRMADALKWLSENDIKEFQVDSLYGQKDYVELKSNINIRDKQTSIEISYGFVRRKSRLSSYEPQITGPQVAEILDNLKDEIMNYLQDEKLQTPFYREGLNLTEEFQVWVRRVCAGMVYEITSNKITIVK